MKRRCTRKHTVYQVPEEDWACPKCGALATDESGFIIDTIWDDEMLEEDVDCVLLHVDDTLRCFVCGYEVSGKRYALHKQKEANAVVCPTCKGKGVVPGPGKKGDA